MGVAKNILKVVDGEGELRIMRHSFAGSNRPFRKTGVDSFQCFNLVVDND